MVFNKAKKSVQTSTLWQETLCLSLFHNKYCVFSGLICFDMFMQQQHNGADFSLGMKTKMQAIFNDLF